MKGRVRILLLATALLLLLATSAWASGAMRVYEYYSDREMTNWVGWRYTNCSLVVVGGDGSTSNYRHVEQENCSTGNITTYCQEWTGTGWSTYPCPW